MPWFAPRRQGFVSVLCVFGPFYYMVAMSSRRVYANTWGTKRSDGLTSEYSDATTLIWLSGPAIQQQ